MSDENKDSNGDSPLNEPNVWLAAWIFLVVVFLLTPFCASARRRKICRSRLRERRWNVDVEEEEDSWFVGALQRYNEQMAARENQNGTNRTRRSTLSKEEEEKIKLFLKEKMSGFTTVIEKDDLRSISKETNGNNEESSVIDDYGNSKCNSRSDGFIDEEEIKKSPSPASTDGANENESSPSEMKSDVSTDENGETGNMVCIDIGDDISIKSGSDNSVNEQSILKCESFASSTVQGQFTHVVVPLPGTCLPLKQTIEIDENEGDIEHGRDSESPTTSKDKRLVSKCCAVCLSEFEKGDRICWSSNTQCPHVFHADCILTWYIAISKKTNRGRQREGVAEKDITDFPMLCPCCRQDFLPTSTEASAEKDASSPAEEATEAVENA